MWFRRNRRQKWHMASYGGSIAVCGRDIGVAACYSSERIDMTIEEAQKRTDTCRSCINAVMEVRKSLGEANA